MGIRKITLCNQFVAGDFPVYKHAHDLLTFGASPVGNFIPNLTHK